MRFDSPLRYPGGKASIAAFLARTIELNGLSGCSYLEPFAGGAGAALRLLRDGIVSELHLNDLDPRIIAFWRAVLDESERFADAVLAVPVNIEEWERQKQVYRLADQDKPFELGFATFYHIFSQPLQPVGHYFRRSAHRGLCASRGVENGRTLL